MKTLSTPRRFAARALAAAVSAALLAFAGASSFAANAAPEKAPAKAIKVAILPVLNGSPDLSATKIMDDILRDQLKTVPPSRATFLLPIDSERILTQRNELDRGARLNERWSKLGTIDSTAMAGLDSVLMVDAVLFVKVNEWENHRVPVVGAGESSTTIGLAFACYDLQSMKRIWFKNPREQRFGQEIDPSSGAVTYDETGFIQNKRANAPPRYEDVASDLVRDAFKKFPTK
jgi:hypothetical protein